MRRVTVCKGKGQQSTLAGAAPVLITWIRKVSSSIGSGGPWWKPGSPTTLEPVNGEDVTVVSLLIAKTVINCEN